MQKRADSDGWGAGLAAFVVAFLGLAVLLTVAVVPEVLRGGLIETDNYMRLVRVSQLVDGGGWFDSGIPRSNAPFGEVLHWTRPLDILILAAAAPLRLVMPFPAAVHLAGVVLPPLLLLLTCVAAAWAAIPLGGKGSRFYAMIAVVAQPAVVAYGLPGRIDHHVLLLLLFALVVGGLARGLQDPQARHAWAATGALLGAGLWVGPEFLLPLALALAVGAWVWVQEGGAWGRAQFALGTGLLGVVGVAVLVEHPPSSWLLAEFDRISAPHLFMAVLVVAFWAPAAGRTRPVAAFGSRGRRLVWAVVGGAVALGVMALTYPDFFAGPAGTVDGSIRERWFDVITERTSWLPPRSVAELGGVVGHLGGIAWALPFALWHLARGSGPGHRPVWTFVTVALIVYTGLSLARVRHLPYAEILIALLTAALLARAAARRPLLRAGIASALIAGPLYAGAVLTALGGRSALDVRAMEAEAATLCPLPELAAFLSSPAGPGDRPRTLAAHIDFGPEILYRTPHRVLGTPYHRNVAGIGAVFDILGAEDPERARQVLRDREVELVLVCPLQTPVYGTPAGGAGRGPTLPDRLVAGLPPEWLEPIPLPPEAGSFRLFRVLGER